MHITKFVLGCAGVMALMTAAPSRDGFPQQALPTIHTIETHPPLRFPFGLARGPDGAIIVSHDGRAISLVNDDGGLTSIAGGAEQGFEGDEKPAVESLLYGPGKAAFDRHGHLFIPDMVNHRIRKIDAETGIMTTVVGRGVAGRDVGAFGGDGGPAIEAFLNRPIAVAFDRHDALFIADGGNRRVRKVTPGADGILSGAEDEIIETVAGNGKDGFAWDGKPATLARVTAVDLAFDAAGHLFLVDAINNRIRRIDKDSGIIDTVVGSGPVGELGGYSGNDVHPTKARLSSPKGITFDSHGNLFIADDYNHRIRMVTPGSDGIISGGPDERIITVVGTGTIGIQGGGYSGDGRPPLKAKLNRPQDVAIDGAGNLVIVDGLNHRLRRVPLWALLNPAMNL